jgi:hypothetical protein
MEQSTVRWILWAVIVVLGAALFWHYGRKK